MMIGSKPMKRTVVLPQRKNAFGGFCWPYYALRKGASMPIWKRQDVKRPWEDDQNLGKASASVRILGTELF